ncbi:sensor histidine kinase, partial [Bradyrhizobium sp. NAS80.1]|uniref:sensor histidine kinase n=1 Tax=Bradyrhizobium sp. NAS80.1 TaxID=1680159 RepID=UPI001160EBEF
MHLRRPLEDGGAGTLWVVGSKPGFFSQEHARVLTELAAFASVAIRMIRAEEVVQSALQEQEQLTREMAHRLKNLLAITDGMLRLTARTTATKEELVAKMSGRLLALANANQLVRRSFAHDTMSRVGLQQLMETILKPYEHVSTAGPDVALGDHASNSMALVFHELATNAAKYGALSLDEGHVDVGWLVHEDLPRLPALPFQRAVPITPVNQTGACVDCFPVRAAFPAMRSGRHSHSNFRGVLRLHSRYGPLDCSAAQGDLCHEASVRPIA